MIGELEENSIVNCIFTTVIDGWDTWCKIFHSVEVWEPLINFILAKENLPVSKIENLHPGSNAVFKSRDYVVKIFAPPELGFYGDTNYKTEKFALDFAYSHGVPVPKLVACGEINDKYDFPFMVMDYIDGVDFNVYSEKFTDDEKFEFGKRLRKITDAMNKPCEDFNGIDVIHNSDRDKRWKKFSARFKTERLEYLYSHDFGEKVFVHGDLCYDNFVIDKKGDIYILDFADAVMAPVCYEYALVSCLFHFDEAYLRGYFGEYKTDEIVDICFDGILIHEFGMEIIMDFAKVEEIDCLNDLRDKLWDLIK